jgi:hypothetical protein
MCVNCGVTASGPTTPVATALDAADASRTLSSRGRCRVVQAARGGEPQGAAEAVITAMRPVKFSPLSIGGPGAWHVSLAVPQSPAHCRSNLAIDRDYIVT